MAAPLVPRAPNIFRILNPFPHRWFSSAVRRYSEAAASSSHPQKNDVGLEVEQIKVPKRIKRSPTALLESLSETVEKDPLGPHYRFVDDPFLIPNDMASKRNYALSKASGKKAAQWVMKTYYTGFVRDTAVPSIPEFNPKHAADKILKHESGEEAIKWMLRCGLPKDAFDYYQKMKEEGTALSAEVMQDVLEQLCVYTNKNKPDRVFPEDQFYIREVNKNERFKVKDTWGDSAPAEQLFEDLPEKTPAAYRSLIRGMSKANHAERVIELYEEMVEMKIPCDVQTYTAVLYVIPILSDEADSRWSLMEKVLTDMKENDVEPNLGTFNAVMFGLGQWMNRWYRSSSMSLQVLREMKACGIEPSLGTWRSVIEVFYSRDSSQATILNEIIDHIQGKHFTFQHPADLDFFRVAMLKCCIVLKDLDLAYKIDALLNTGRNHLLLGDSYNEMIYYNQFFKLLCSVEEIEKVMAVYDRCVPHIWSPSFANFAELLSMLDMYDAYQHVPQVWSDLVAFDFIRREDLVEPVFTLLAKKKQEAQLQEVFHAIIKKYMEDVKEAEEDERQRRRPPVLTGPMFGSMIQVCLNSDQFEDAWNLFEMFEKKKGSGSGIPSEDSLKQLANVCLASKDGDKTMRVISTISDLAYPCVADLVEKAKSDLKLTESQCQQLSLMV